MTDQFNNSQEELKIAKNKSELKDREISSHLERIASLEKEVVSLKKDMSTKDVQIMVSEQQRKSDIEERDQEIKRLRNRLEVTEHKLILLLFCCCLTWLFIYSH